MATLVYSIVCNNFLEGFWTLRASNHWKLKAKRGSPNIDWIANGLEIGGLKATKQFFEDVLNVGNWNITYTFWTLEFMHEAFWRLFSIKTRSQCNYEFILLWSCNCHLSLNSNIICQFKRLKSRPFKERTETLESALR